MSHSISGDGGASKGGAIREEVIAIVPAAGSSSRMGSSVSKLLLHLSTSTVIQRTVASLIEGGVSSVVVLARELDLQSLRRELVSFPVTVITGGETRQESVANGVRYLSDRIAEDCIVLVHDGARCMASPGLIRRCISGARESGAISAALPVHDTLCRSEIEDTYGPIVDRGGLHQIQTPQGFRFGLLKRAHAEASFKATDDASLVSQIHPVKLVEGEWENIKITTPRDLELAERLIQAGSSFKNVIGE